MKYITIALMSLIVVVFGATVAGALAQYDWTNGVLRVSEKYINIADDICNTSIMTGSYIKNGAVAYMSQNACVTRLNPGNDNTFDLVTSPDAHDIANLVNVIGILPHDSPDGRFIYIDNPEDSIPGIANVSYHRPSGRVFVMRGSGYSQPFNIYVYSSIMLSIDAQMMNDRIAEYTVKEGSTAVYGDIAGITPISMLFTDNGNYVMYTRLEGYKTVLRKVNLSNNSVEDKVLSQSTGYGNISIYTATHNGRYIYAQVGTELNDRPMIFDTESCATECDVRDLSPLLSSHNTGGNPFPRIYASFSNDDDRLQLIIVDSWYFKTAQSLTIAMVPENLINFSYLALGDSFSSGEGDLGINSLTKANYYRAHTDDDGYIFIDEVRNKVRPIEKCHLSTRSYPYKLAAGMKLGDSWSGDHGLWGSVACSGAVISDIESDDSSSYMGQKTSGGGMPRLQGYSYSDLKDQALNDMIPGRHKQIEFVEKYRPKVVTLTGGGNDVSFGDILRACVQPLGFGSEWTSTCSYAKDDGKKANIANAIVDLRPKLVKLYQQILEAGDKGMKLYVLGYPVFVDDERAKNNYIIENIATCGANVRLNYQERQMVAESTRFLNLVIQSAAREAGAVYISTTSAFGGHKLCGESSTRSVNGITGAADTAESFHPNELGHAMLANRVWDATGGKSLIDYECDPSPYVACPDNVAHEVTIPDYFKNALANNIKTKLNNELSQDVLSKIDKAILTIADYTLLFNNPLAILLYSDRTEIGNFTTNEHGGFSGEITIPASVKPGYHTLEVVSLDVSGNPISLWKVVEIRSGDPGDYDGDGIPNDEDICTYIEPIGVDSDKDGIDDGCDAEIDTISWDKIGERMKDLNDLGRKAQHGVDGSIAQSGSLFPLVSQQTLAEHWNTIRKDALSMGSAEQSDNSSQTLVIGFFAVALAVSVILLRKRD